MKKILILGVSGMAGHIVFTYLSELEKYEILGTTNSNSFGANTIKFDIHNEERLDEILLDFRPDFVINCIGILIKGSHNSPDNAIFANSYFPHLLAKYSNNYGFKLIHISTDCVFSGKSGSYTEKDIKDATDLYGVSKSLGEVLDERNLTIRTSIIGPEIKENGEGLFHWFMYQKDQVNGYKSNFWSGVTTLELAFFIDWILEKNITGLVHLTNNESISKFDLLTLIGKVFKKNIMILNNKDYTCDKSFLNTNQVINFEVSSYEKMIIDIENFMSKHYNLYGHYFVE